MANFTDVVMWGQGLEQQAQQNADRHQIVLSNLAGAKLNQESVALDLQQKKAEFANEEAFKKSVLSQLSQGEEARSDLSKLSGEPTPYQNLQNSLADSKDKITQHISLVQATQKAIEQYSKVDPIYAQRMQDQLNKQIGEGFKLTKEHNDIKEKEAEKVSGELFPVLNAGGVPGKFDPALYQQWYQNRKDEGVPLASLGLTGDPSLDEKQIRLVYSHGVAAKDQATQQSRFLAEQERAWMDKVRAEKYSSDIQHQRATEATSRERLDKGKPAKDPVVVERKYQDAAYTKYRTQYDRLVAQRRRATDDVTKRDIDRQIQSLNDSFEEQKKSIRSSYKLTDKGTGGETPTTNIEEDLISKYSK